MHPQNPPRFSAPWPYWPQTDDSERVRFIIGDGLHFATTAAALGTFLCVAFVAQAAHAQGKGLDFTWVGLAGRADLPAMPVLQTFRSILPIAFIFPALVWIYSRMASWEYRAEHERLFQRYGTPAWSRGCDAGDEDLPLRPLAEGVAHASAGILISLIIYASLAQALAGWRGAPQFEIALDGLVVAGVATCLAALVIDRLGRMLRALTRPRA